jgi:hypothetical protein
MDTSDLSFFNNSELNFASSSSDSSEAANEIAFYPFQAKMEYFEDSQIAGFIKLSTKLGLKKGVILVFLESEENCKLPILDKNYPACLEIANLRTQKKALQHFNEIQEERRKKKLRANIKKNIVHISGKEYMDFNSELRSNIGGNSHSRQRSKSRKSGRGNSFISKKSRRKSIRDSLRKSFNNLVIQDQIEERRLNKKVRSMKKGQSLRSENQIYKRVRRGKSGSRNNSMVVTPLMKPKKLNQVLSINTPQKERMSLGPLPPLYSVNQKSKNRKDVSNFLWDSNLELENLRANEAKLGYTKHRSSSNNENSLNKENSEKFEPPARHPLETVQEAPNILINGTGHTEINTDQTPIFNSLVMDNKSEKSNIHSNNNEFLLHKLDTKISKIPLYCREVKLFTFLKEIKPPQMYLVMPLRITLKKEVPLSYSSFFSFSKPKSHIQEELNRQCRTLNLKNRLKERLKVQFMEDMQDDTNEEVKTKNMDFSTLWKTKIARKKEYLKVINKLWVVYAPTSVYNKVKENPLPLTRLFLYKNHPSCCAYMKQFQIIKNYSTLKYRPFSSQQKILLYKSVKPVYCGLCKKEGKKFGQVWVSIDKEFISNFDDCFNFVFKFQKSILKKYRCLDILVKARLDKPRQPSATLSEVGEAEKTPKNRNLELENSRQKVKKISEGNFLERVLYTHSYSLDKYLPKNVTNLDEVEYEIVRKIDLIDISRTNLVTIDLGVNKLKYYLCFFLSKERYSFDEMFIEKEIKFYQFKKNYEMKTKLDNIKAIRSLEKKINLEQIPSNFPVIGLPFGEVELGE